jgi:4-hydroxythreonine-4-phosphate dehydrogenase
MSSELPVLAVTPGEPSGIGPEILLKIAAAEPRFRLLAVADIAMLRQTADSLGLQVEIEEWRPGDTPSAERLSCLHVPLEEPTVPGQLSTRNAAYVLRTLCEAVRLLDEGHAAALVTGPVHKGVINDAGVAFSGHTEVLAELSETPSVVMMLAAPGLRVVLVTTHLPLRKVADAITPERLETTLRITHHDLKHRFGIERPRLQVLGLNPHAGEGGHLGNEEIEIIAPVLERCRQAGMDLTGPVPADTAFTPSRIDNCDAVVAMYHDQGLPVLKHAGFGEAVNITLGLPFIRTSVDHGTALDIAGRGVADERSLLQALETAQQMAARNR